MVSSSNTPGAWDAVRTGRFGRIVTSFGRSIRVIRVVRTGRHEVSADAAIHAFSKGLSVCRASISLIALGNTLGGIVGHRIAGTRDLVAFREAADILRVT